MQSGLLLLGLATGVLLGLYWDLWGVVRSAISAVLTAATLGILGWIADGREGVLGTYLMRLAGAVAIPAIVVIVIRSYT